MLRDPKQAELLKKKKRHKYGAKRVELDGYKFDSIAEAARYIQLKAMQDRGEIQYLTVHHTFHFASGVKYVCDFHYSKEWTDGDGCRWIHDYTEDVKGFETAAFKIKRKLLRKEYQQEITVIKMDSKTANALVAAQIGSECRIREGRKSPSSKSTRSGGSSKRA